MNALRLTQIVQHVAEPTCIPEPDASDASFVLHLLAGSLSATRLSVGEPPFPAAAGQAGVIALLHWLSAARNRGWYLVPASSQLGLNGMAPPLPVARIEPGNWLSFGSRFWLVSAFWEPEPSEVPAELAAEACPVCGAALSLARVVQCPCGRWSHLERPEVPDDPEALNCFLAASTCGACDRPTSLAPVIRPEVPVNVSSVIEEVSR